MPDAATRGMLDTSTVILLGRIDDPAALPDEAAIGAITLAELSVGPHVARSENERLARQAYLQQVEEVVKDLNSFLRGWADYFRYGHFAIRNPHWSADL
jgi:predicted nucleic acid-binding protein